jgi:cytidylate kinase
MAKITLFGLAGTGTSSTGKLLAKQLGYEFMSSGNMFRAKAESLGVSLSEFERMCMEDPAHDKALDQDVAEFGKTHDNFVVESRLAWHFIPDSVKVKLVCRTDERMRRVAHRDGQTLPEAIALTEHREGLHPLRYREYYGIEDYQADSHFDIVVDTTDISLERVVTTIRSRLGL